MTATLEPAKTKNLEKIEQVFLRPIRFTLFMFERMLETGVIGDDPRVELLDGQIVEMEPVNTPHVNRVKDLYDRPQKLFVDRTDVYSQSPIELPSDGRPQPDLTILKSGSAREHLPQPEDVLLLIEVSESTLEKNRNAKLALYARDGINEYWIVNLQDNQLEVYRDPQRERYTTSFTLKPGSSQACLAFPDDAIDWS
jgi:Uma2 family endonuclease